MEVEGFFSHEAKLNAAAQFIPEGQMLLHKGGFEHMAFAKGFDLGNAADAGARLDGLYVHWNGKEWTIGVRVDPAVLAESIATVGAIIGAKRAKWL